MPLFTRWCLEAEGNELNKFLRNQAGRGFLFWVWRGGGLRDEEVSVADQGKGNKLYTCWCREAERNEPQ